MSKRKRSKGKRSNPARKARSTGPRTVAAEDRPFVEPIGPFVGQADALTPAPALPSERARRDRAARGGRSTMGDAEPMAMIPQPPARAEEPAAPARREEPASKGTLSQSQIYEKLAALLVPYARRMESEMHPKIGFCLKAKCARTGRETHFGAVQALQDGVAFHLFPLYGHPDLLDDISPELFNRMRGKTCFHFQELDDAIVSELAELTHEGFERFVADGVF